MNSRSRINRFQFAKVFWDYAAAGSQAEAEEKPTGSLGNVSDHPSELATSCKKADEENVKKSDNSKLFSQSRVLPASAKPPAQGKKCCRRNKTLSEISSLKSNLFLYTQRGQGRDISASK